MDEQNQKTENQKNLSLLIEAILFWSAEPKTIKELASATNSNSEEVKIAISELSDSLIGRGIVLIQNSDEISLATSPQSVDVIEKLRKEELSRELTKSTLETLTAVAYAGPIARTEIDYLRGVNCQYALRHLSMRGLVVREDSGEDRGRYRVTTELLANMGITKVEDLPNYLESRKSLRDALLAANNSDKTVAPPESVTESSE